MKNKLCCQTAVLMSVYFVALLCKGMLFNYVQALIAVVGNINYII